MTTHTVSALGRRLENNEVHARFVAHPFFEMVRSDQLDRAQVAQFLGQWWHPLHYFPTFLARCVASLPDIAAKSAVADILNQEAGCGDPAKAHEVIYIRSMAEVGFDAVTQAPPTPESAALVAGYAEASGNQLAALGFIFATEVTDLLMVSSIGQAVSQVTGVLYNEWVDIHVLQEPGHVDSANDAMLSGFSAADEDAIIASAERMWQLWIGFFDALVRQLKTPAVAVNTPYSAVGGARGD
jgi:thiaminase